MSDFCSVYMLADIDECRTDNKCSTGSTCVNTNGSYTCECPAGYSLLADQRTCDGKLVLCPRRRGALSHRSENVFTFFYFGHVF